MLGERGHKPRLADTRITDHEMHATMTATCILEGVMQLA
jgi:hypothetical protein